MNCVYIVRLLRITIGPLYSYEICFQHFRNFWFTSSLVVSFVQLILGLVHADMYIIQTWSIKVTFTVSITNHFTLTKLILQIDMILLRYWHNIYINF